MEHIIEYIVEEALVMIPVLIFIGWMIKQTEQIRDYLIPYILLVIGVGFTPWLIGGFTPDNIVQGALVTAASVLAHQLYKQGKRIKGDDN